MHFKLNNTIILYKPKKVFNIPQEMSNFVDLMVSICVQSNRHTLPVVSNVYGFQRWLCILQHRINGSHLIIGGKFATNQDRDDMTEESFYNDPGSLQSD